MRVRLLFFFFFCFFFFLELTRVVHEFCAAPHQDDSTEAVLQWKIRGQPSCAHPDVHLFSRTRGHIFDIPARVSNGHSYHSIQMFPQWPQHAWTRLPLSFGRSSASWALEPGALVQTQRAWFGSCPLTPLRLGQLALVGWPGVVLTELSFSTVLSCDFPGTQAPTKPKRHARQTQQTQRV